MAIPFTAPANIEEGCMVVTYTVGGISILCHFEKHYLMPVIICKNNKYLVTFYNEIFSNMTGILSHLSYIFY